MVSVSSASASDLDEFRVKREPVFDFAQKPIVTRQGDRVTISFEAQGFCDATVAIEDASGRIVRHLASGVLGPNAPEPFQRNSKKQVIVWDSKKDKGEYVDNTDDLTVRVSLGLEPRFERTLFWEPKKRSSSASPLIRAAPEGVYVLDGEGADHLRLFDHDGNYVRTVYPFPADRLDRVQGLTWYDFPQDGKRLPLMQGFYQSTLLTSGESGIINPRDAGHPLGFTGRAATAMAVRGQRIALVEQRLNRVATDGTTGGLPLTGPMASYNLGRAGWPYIERDTFATPHSAALSPDGRWLYLTAFFWKQPHSAQKNWVCYHHVARLPVEKDGPLEVFLGAVKEPGNDNAHFKVPTAIACDGQGHLYVSDFGNDRIQVFAPDGRHLQSIRTPNPTWVCLDRRAEEIYVFSWSIPGFPGIPGGTFPTRMTRLSPFPEAKELASYSLPLFQGFHLPEAVVASGIWFAGHGQIYTADVDAWTDPPTIWLAAEKHGRHSWGTAGIRLLVEKDGALMVKRDFGADVKRATVRDYPAESARQRLFVNPAAGHLYVGEGISFDQVVEIDPEMGRERLVNLPFDTEDLVFDADGLAYLRSRFDVVRYDARNWKEVPFDYGEERKGVAYSSSSNRRRAAVVGAISAPGAHWHMATMSISPTRHMVVSSHVAEPAEERMYAKSTREEALLRGFRPVLYPGRAVHYRAPILNIWDEHGLLLKRDCIPGLGFAFLGTGIDRDDSLYVMTGSTRWLDGKPYFNIPTGTLMKFVPKKGRILSSAAPIPLAPEARPNRPPDISDQILRDAWGEGCEWMYGGVGHNNRNRNYCGCSNAKFALDSFARSFAPEIGHFSVAVLDANGNLILRVGKYGNVEDGVPLVKEGGPPSPRSIGGDEVGLIWGAYLATHTDRRLFIADAGNARILSVKLDYHATERIALKDVPEKERE